MLSHSYLTVCQTCSQDTLGSVEFENESGLSHQLCECLELLARDRLSDVSALSVKARVCVCVCVCVCDQIAQTCGQHGTLGQDLVAMCVNDVLAQGAEPLLFLDYFSCGQLDVCVASTVIGGIAEACKMAGCALLGEC